DDPEVKKSTLVNAISLKEEKNLTTQLTEYYSRWDSLKRAVAWILRLKNILKISSKKENSKCNLSVKDLKEAEDSIIQHVQRQHFKEELGDLGNGNQIKARSPIVTLNPVLENGLLRVGGRLRKPAMPAEQKNPMILPKNSHVSKLILKHIHEQIGNSGRSYMLSKLREHYWLPCANSAARSILRQCIFCRCFQAKVGEQKMADLPQDRITSDLPPFTHVGIDYFGPLEVKRGHIHIKKVWSYLYLSGVVLSILKLQVLLIQNPA
ncbi:hypothetical protein LDENG_00240760, partial [Lucifuga dentata]